MKAAKPNPIVAAARSWIGTRFHHQGRLKKTANHKGGVDCLGLLAGVAGELDLRGPAGAPLVSFDESDYPHQPDARYLFTRLSQLLTIVIPAKAGIQCAASAAQKDSHRAHGALLDASFRWHDNIIPGDIVLLRIDESPQHLAIVSDVGNNLGLIHAYAPARAVVEHALDDWWRERIEVAFRAVIPA